MPLEEKLREGHELFKAGRLKEALAIYDEVIQAGKTGRTLLIRRGDILADAYQFDKAIADYEAATLSSQSEFSSDVKTLNLLRDKIEICLREKAFFKSKNCDLSLGIELLERRATAAQLKGIEALEAWQRLESDLPLRGVECFFCAQECNSQNKPYEALDWLDKAEELGFDLLKILSLKSYLQKSLRQFAKAQETSARWFELSKEPKAKLIEAMCHYHIGNYEKAVEAFEFVQSQGLAFNENTIMQFGLSLRESGAIEKSKSIFKQLPSNARCLQNGSPNIFSSHDPLSIVRERKKKWLELDTVCPESNRHFVSCICITMRPHRLSEVWNNFKSQKFENKELVLVFNRADFSKVACLNEITEDSSATIVEADTDLTVGQLFALGVTKTKGDLLAKFDDDDDYGPRYLQDLVSFLISTNSDLVGKATRFVHLEELDQLYMRRPGNVNTENVTNVSGSSMLFRKKILDSVEWPEIHAGEDTEFLKRVLNAKLKISSGDEFSYLITRRKDVSSHTWKLDSSGIKKSSALIAKGRHAELILADHA